MLVVRHMKLQGDFKSTPPRPYAGQARHIAVVDHSGKDQRVVAEKERQHAQESLAKSPGI